MKNKLLLALLLFAAPALAQVTNTLVFMTASAVSSSQKTWVGGIGDFVCVGTWNGATVTLQFLGPDGTTLVTAGTATTLTANGAGVFYLYRGLMQATITGAGGSTSLSCSAYAVPSVVQ